MAGLVPAIHAVVPQITLRAIGLANIDLKRQVFLTVEYSSTCGWRRNAGMAGTSPAMTVGPLSLTDALALGRFRARP